MQSQCITPTMFHYRVYGSLDRYFSYISSEHTPLVGLGSLCPVLSSCKIFMALIPQ